MVRARWNVCLVSKTSCMFCWEKLRKKFSFSSHFSPMRWKSKGPAGVRQRPALPWMRIQVGDQVSPQFVTLISWQTHHPTSWYQSGRSVDTSQWIVASFNFKYWQLFKMHNSSCACVILFLVWDTVERGSPLKSKAYGNNSNWFNVMKWQLCVTVKQAKSTKQRHKIHKSMV